MALILITGPASEPITLAEAKERARIDGTEFDAMIPGYITAARQLAEQKLGRALITQTWEQVIDAFPEHHDKRIVLGMPPIVSVASVKYLDLAGDEQTWAPSEYVVDKDNDPGWISLGYAKVWPTTRCVPNAVRARFTCGYGSAAAVPQSIKDWMYAMVASMVNQPSLATCKPAETSPLLDGLLDRYKVWAPRTR